MKVDSHEILYIKDNAPYGMIRMVANNVGIPYEKVRHELASLKKDYNDKIVIEARRLLKETAGLVYNPNEVAA